MVIDTDKSVHEADRETTETEFGSVDVIRFLSPDNYHLDIDENKVKHTIAKELIKRLSLPFEIDGVVYAIKRESVWKLVHQIHERLS